MHTRMKHSFMYQSVVLASSHRCDSLTETTPQLKQKQTGHHVFTIRCDCMVAHTHQREVYPLAEPDSYVQLAILAMILLMCILPQTVRCSLSIFFYPTTSLPPLRLAQCTDPTRMIQHVNCTHLSLPAGRLPSRWTL